MEVGQLRHSQLQDFDRNMDGDQGDSRWRRNIGTSERQPALIGIGHVQVGILSVRFSDPPVPLETLGQGLQVGRGDHILSSTGSTSAI